MPRSFPRLLVLLLVSGPPLAAQSAAISFTPYLGIYAPAADAARIPGGVTARQEASLALGGRVGIPIRGRIGLELAGEYAPSDIRFRYSGTEQVTDARVLSAAAKLSWAAVRPANRIDLLVSGGVSLVDHGGLAYSGRIHRTRIGGVLGASAGLRFSRALRVQLALEDYVYRSDLTPIAVPLLRAGTVDVLPDPTAGYRLTQHDVHVTVGMTIR